MHIVNNNKKKTEDKNLEVAFIFKFFLKNNNKLMNENVVFYFLFVL